MSDHPSTNIGDDYMQAMMEPPGQSPDSACPPEGYKHSAPTHIMCIGWPTIKRLMAGEAVWFDDLQCGAMAASDLLASPGNGVSREDIAALIREGFEAPPDDWPEREPWADGAIDIADRILEMFRIP